MLTLYLDDDSEISVPVKWEICGHCRGHGKSSAYLGAYTGDRWEQTDQEFREDYFAGRFDRTCEHCNGLGRVETADLERMPEEHRKAWREQRRAEAEERAAERAEYRYCYGREG